jgi:hypothetical protein
MNFVAGLLLLYFKDESVAFKAMQNIIEVFDMGSLFNDDLHKLKLSFYIFDRLLSIRMPRLHAHFQQEQINSSYFSAPWFITLFANSLQLQASGEIDEAQLQLWDYFLVVSCCIYF